MANDNNTVGIHLIEIGQNIPIRIEKKLGMSTRLISEKITL